MRVYGGRMRTPARSPCRIHTHRRMRLHRSRPRRAAGRARPADRGQRGGDDRRSTARRSDAGRLVGQPHLHRHVHLARRSGRRDPMPLDDEHLHRMGEPDQSVDADRLLLHRRITNVARRVCDAPAGRVGVLRRQPRGLRGRHRTTTRWRTDAAAMNSSRRTVVTPAPARSMPHHIDPDVAADESHAAPFVVL